MIMTPKPPSPAPLLPRYPDLNPPEKQLHKLETQHNTKIGNKKLKCVKYYIYHGLLS